MRKKRLLITAIDPIKFNKIINILNEKQIKFDYKQDIFTESITKTTFKWDIFVPQNQYDYAKHIIRNI